MNKEEKALEVRNVAGNYFKEGFNCTESIFMTFREELSPDMSPDTVKLFTGFGSGLGEAGCLCGALTGSIVAINMLAGRTGLSESRDPAYNLAQEFHNRFEEKFGATCCRVLNQHPFETREHLTTCLKITGNTAKLLMEFLQEKNLVE
ncbi:MAG TPA: C-GCAxxG-C-C family (seleno)protein [Bacillota bacterium]|nr:C-GCAxxG-C-C family (seleno)protein [Bacillota bacterium]